MLTDLRSLPLIFLLLVTSIVIFLEGWHKSYTPPSTMSPADPFLKCFQTAQNEAFQGSSANLPPPAQWKKGQGGPPYHSAGVLEQRGFFTKLKVWGFDPKFILDVGANEGGWAREVFNEFGGTPQILCVEGSSKRTAVLDTFGFDYVISLVGPNNLFAEFYDKFVSFPLFLQRFILLLILIIHTCQTIFFLARVGLTRGIPCLKKKLHFTREQNPL
jgi:hypothetical protein